MAVFLLLRFDMKLAQFFIIHFASVLGVFQIAGTVWGLETDALVVLGAAGDDEFAPDFEEAAQAWERTLKAINASAEILGRDQEARAKMLAWIQSRKDSRNSEHWLILIGHGTYQQKIAKFNLLGEDVSADELQQQMKQAGGNWRIIVCASSSSPFITALSGPNRVIITATKSGSEQNYSRFGTYLARSISDVRADVDHDGGVSLLEAFVDASSRLAEWYQSENRLATEQALLDDNGDQRGTPAVFFQGTRAVKAAAKGLELDGALANQCFLAIPKFPTGWNDKKQAEAVAIETEINRLRAEKTRLSEDEYFERLEKLLLDMARLVAEPKKSDAKKK